MMLDERKVHLIGARTIAPEDATHRASWANAWGRPDQYAMTSAQERLRFGKIERDNKAKAADIAFMTFDADSFEIQLCDDVGLRPKEQRNQMIGAIDKVRSLAALGGPAATRLVLGMGPFHSLTHLAARLASIADCVRFEWITWFANRRFT